MEMVGKDDDSVDGERVFGLHLPQGITEAIDVVDQQGAAPFGDEGEEVACSLDSYSSEVHRWVPVRGRWARCALCILTSRRGSETSAE